MRYGLLEGLLSQQCGGWILGGCGQKKNVACRFSQQPTLISIKWSATAAT